MYIFPVVSFESIKIIMSQTLIQKFPTHCQKMFLIGADFSDLVKIFPRFDKNVSPGLDLIGQKIYFN